MQTLGLFHLPIHHCFKHFLNVEGHCAAPGVPLWDSTDSTNSQGSQQEDDMTQRLCALFMEKCDYSLQDLGYDGVARDGWNGNAFETPIFLGGGQCRNRITENLEWSSQAPPSQKNTVIPAMVLTFFLTHLAGTRRRALSSSRVSSGSAH